MVSLNLNAMCHSALQSRVALLSTQPQTVLTDYLRLLAQLKIEPALLQSVLLLPDASGSFSQPGCFTTPWQLEGIVQGLRSLGATRIALLGTRPQSDDLTALAQTAQGLGLGWQQQLSSASLLVLLPTLHRRPGVRMAGALWLASTRDQGSGIRDQGPGRDEATRRQGDGRMRIAGGGCIEETKAKLAPCFSWCPGLLNVLLRPAQVTFHTGLLDAIPTLAVMDATTVGNGVGDYADRPQVGNLLLASRDVVALDAVAAQLLDLDGIRDLVLLRQAQERGLGIADLARIELCGEREMFERRFPRCPAHLPWLSRSPYRAWRYETGWGELFCEYHM